MTMTAIDLVAEAKQHITEINIEEAKQAIATDLILDVREPAEYAAGCLPGAINIPRGVLEFKITSHPEFQYKQDSKIIVYCQSGGRSALATEVLNKLGYKNAVSLKGGYKAWLESGLHVSKPESA